MTMPYAMRRVSYEIWRNGATQTSLTDFYQVIDALNAACGSGDVFGPDSDLRVFYITCQRDHAVTHFDLGSVDVLRDITLLDFRQYIIFASLHYRYGDVYPILV